MSFFVLFLVLFCVCYLSLLCNPLGRKRKLLNSLEHLKRRLRNAFSVKVKVFNRLIDAKISIYLSK